MTELSNAHPATLAEGEALAVADAARGEIKAPEHLDSAAEPARAPVKPPEPNQPDTSAAVTPVAVATPQPVAAGASVVISPEVFSKAEANLAAYIGTKLNPALTNGLMLTLSNIISDDPAGKMGGTDLKLCFKGPMVEANFAEMQRELVHALRDHPAIKSLFAERCSVNIDQVSTDDAGQMLHFHLPVMTPEQYALLMHALAEGKTIAHTAHGDKQTSATGHHGHKAEEEVAAEVAPKVEEKPVTPVAAPVVEPVKKDEAAEVVAPKVEEKAVVHTGEPVKKDEIATAAPTATVGVPGTPLGKVVGDQQISMSA